MILGQWCTDKKRTPKLRTSSGFRLVRVFSDQHNADRFRVHVKKLFKKFDLSRDQKKFRLKLRSRRRAKKKAPDLAQQPGTGRGVTGINLAASIATS